MPEITIYTTPTCPYCLRAKALLREKNLAFTEISVAGDAKLRREMTERTGRTSVPQIFFGDEAGGALGAEKRFDVDFGGLKDITKLLLSLKFHVKAE